MLLGWTSREDVLGPHTELVTTNGIFRPFAMVDGRAVATWRLTRARSRSSRSAQIAREGRAALDADAADVERFMAGA